MNKNERGITLIALIITVIVLLILAGTAISIAINGGDIFGKAQEAGESWNISVADEEQKIHNVMDILNSMDSSVNENLISKDASINNGNGYIGYYADFDGQPGVDGIIYADLLVQKPESGSWGSNSSFTMSSDVTEQNVKDYIISSEPVTDARFEKSDANPSTYTARYVISPASSSTGTKNRFYVMGLDEIIDGSNTSLYWFYNAKGYISNYSTVTSQAFDSGKTNTDTMITKWNLGSGEGGYGATNDRDMWKWVEAKRVDYAGWFVPSSGEWSAFCKAFNISDSSANSGYYSNYGLLSAYWTSSLTGSGMAHIIYFGGNGLGYQNINQLSSVRLSAII